MRKNHKRLVVVLMVAVMVCCMATTAFARSISDFTWLQSVSNKEISLGQMTPSSTVNGRIMFYAVATSPEHGTFQVILQRQGFLGIWSNVGSRFTVNQSSEWKYDSRNGGNVVGEPFICIWPTDSSGNYRIILENPTAPQSTVFTRVEVWAE